MHKYFLTTYIKTKGKIHRKLCILQKRDIYQNQFSNKKGAIGKPESPKKHPIWATHPRTHLSTKYPPPPGVGEDGKHSIKVHKIKFKNTKHYQLCSIGNIKHCGTNFVILNIF